MIRRIDIKDKLKRKYSGRIFKVGEKVICVNNDNITFNFEGREWYDAGESLILGETYEVTDFIPHTLPEGEGNRPKLVVRELGRDYGGWYYPERFDDIRIQRKDKLNRIKNLLKFDRQMDKKYLRDHYFLYSNENECIEIMKYLQSMDENVFEMDESYPNEWKGWRYVCGEWTQTKEKLENVRVHRKNSFQIKWVEFNRKRKLRKLKENEIQKISET